MSFSSSSILATIAAVTITLSGSASAQSPTSYIVRLKGGVDVDSTLESFRSSHGAEIKHRYRYAFKGGALTLPNEKAKAKIANDPRVENLELDYPVQASARPSKPGGGTPPPQEEPTGYRLIGANQITNKGDGLRVAVLDTGVNLDHPDLAGNLDLSLAIDCVNEGRSAYEDLNGHGTHVSGTIAAVDNTQGSIGVGSRIQIVPVKVLNRRGSGSWSSILCGIDHVTAHAGAIQVANMSLGGAGSECSDETLCTKSSFQLAIEQSVAAGVTYAVAAGNEGSDASTSVPAAFSAVITVSAYSDSDGTLSSNDGWASFTNYGSAVDIAAPGVSIFSTWKDGSYNTISGTSMASPHVAAAAALYLSAYPGSSPAQVKAGLRNAGVQSFPGSTDAKHGEPLLDVRSF